MMYFYGIPSLVASLIFLIFIRQTNYMKQNKVFIHQINIFLINL